jgi:DNA-binding transcriptional ArsR family regulator
MIRLELDDDTLHGVRIAISPLWETVSSLELLARFRGQAPFPYTHWARRACQVCPEVVDRMRGAQVLRLPDLLTPTGLNARANIAEELTALRETPAERIERTLAVHFPDGTPEMLLRLTSGATSLVELADLVEQFWHAAVAPYWPSMRNVLESEILSRGRRLATDGPDAMLGDLGGPVRWDRPVLAAPYQFDIDVKLADSQLLLVPVLFGRGMRIYATDGQAVSALSYQARGAAVLDECVARESAPEGQAADRPDRLAILLGKGRAAVMRSLVVPTTTTAVSDAVGLAPSTVSQHLAALAAAGVVRRRRVGYRVLYELDHGGFALLKHVDGAEAS